MKSYLKKFAVILLTVALTAALMAGCGGGDTPDTETVAEKTLILGAYTDFKQGSGTEGESMVFDTMTSMNARMEVQPNIIASWETNSDCSEYTLKVQEGVTFSDGTPLTAEIVKDSLETWAPYRDGSFMYSLDSIDVDDDRTLTVRLTQGYGNLPIEMSRLYVSLPDSLDDQGNVVNWVGTGPFILEDYQLEQSALLKTNRDYWKKDKVPAIDSVKWVVIPDENSRVMALQSGEVDALGVSEHYCALPYSKVAEFMESDKFTVDLQQELGLISTYVYNYKQGPMTDINLRKAVTLAIDRETIADKIIYNVGKASGDFMTRSVKYSPAKEKEYVFDPEAAKAALRDGGYADSDGDGIVEKDGQPVKLKLVDSSGETARSVAVFIQECLRNAGIDTEVEILDDAAYGDRVASGDFDICYTHPWLTTPQTYMSWRGATSEYDDFGTGFGVSGNFDGYLHTVLTSTDADELQKTFDQIWQEEYAFYPGTGLYIQPRAFIHKKNISGFIFNPSSEIIDLSGVTIE